MMPLNEVNILKAKRKKKRVMPHLNFRFSKQCLKKLNSDMFRSYASNKRSIVSLVSGYLSSKQAYLACLLVRFPCMLCTQSLILPFQMSKARGRAGNYWKSWTFSTLLINGIGPKASPFHRVPYPLHQEPPPFHSVHIVPISPRIFIHFPHKTSTPTSPINAQA